MQEVILTEDELRILCAEYQKTLRLQDWRVHIKVGRLPKGDEDDDATVYYSVENKVATICLCDPTYYPEDSLEPQDMELSLVHDLLHLHLAPLGLSEDDRHSKDAEIAVESMAEAVVNLRRAAHA